MRKLIVFLFFTAISYASMACPVCDRNKKTALEKLSHGSTPNSSWDYIIVIAMIIIAVATLFYSVKWLIKPNENNRSHIKFSFLNEQ